VLTLLQAWERLEADLELHIVGDGPLASHVQRAVARDGRMRWHGHCDHTGVLELLGRAGCLVMPSTWYEGFGLVIIEAYSRGTPVIASDLGAMGELVHHGTTGWLTRPGDAGHLADTVAQAFAEPAQLAAKRTAARECFERRYTADQNYAALIAVLNRARSAR
jgi:glycosyltransferase involved in cell wall biosynthesis